MKRKAHYLIIGFFYFTSLILSAQDQREADSLLPVYKADTLVGQAKMELLANLAFNEINDHNLSLSYADELIGLATQLEDNPYLSQGYFQKGNALGRLGNIEEALAAYLQSASIAKEENNSGFEGSAYGAIASLYAVSENYDNAMAYYRKSIRSLRNSEDTLSLASQILNAGDAFLSKKEFDSALIYFKESGRIFESQDYAIGKAYNLGNMGMAYASTDRNQLAEESMNEAIRILEEYEDYYPISVYMLFMADIYLEKGAQQEALSYANRSLELATKYELKEQISDANLKLSELHEGAGNASLSLNHYKDYIAYRDSIINIENVQSMAEMRREYDVAQKQSEVDLLNQQKRNQLIILGFTGLLLLTLYWYYRTISKEKKRSENLLLNILPSEIAKELKQNGEVDAVKFDTVTVLFTDFVAFSKIAEKVDPEQLVKSIDFYFKKYDQIITKHGLEKIKTVGDSYMCASGLPIPDAEHAINAVKAAREIADVVKKEWVADDTISHFEVRIGLHSGPVVAGIVGTKKWQYDIWGDTVNIASRLESASKPGRINVSETTYQLIKEGFPCEYRGEIEMKNRGMMKMYFVEETS